MGGVVGEVGKGKGILKVDRNIYFLAERDIG